MNDQGDSGWVVEPAAPDAALISVDISNADELTPELRAAVEGLVRALEELPAGVEQAEVEAFRKCGKQTQCAPRTESPCLDKYIIDCRIIACPTWTGM
jgi:hypothetical protein